MKTINEFWIDFAIDLGSILEATVLPKSHQKTILKGAELLDRFNFSYPLGSRWAANVGPGWPLFPSRWAM